MTSSPDLLLRVAPALFTLIWSTGFIAARAVAPYADPLTILTVRYLLAGMVLVAFAAAAGATWPRTRHEWGHALVSGVLLHAIYLGGVWWAVRHGLPAGVSSLITALQPILTAMLAPWIVGERLRPLQLAGIAAGFAGLGLVIGPTLPTGSGAQFTDALVPVAVNIVSALAVTLGTLYQKRFVATGDLRTVTVIQYMAAAAVTLPVAMLLEDMRIEWNLQVIGTLAWSVLALSIGAIALLLMLLRHGAVSRAAALSYLVPVCTALEAYVLFGENLTVVQLAGMMVTAGGVAMIMRR